VGFILFFILFYFYSGALLLSLLLFPLFVGLGEKKILEQEAICLGTGGMDDIMNVCIKR